METPVDTSNNHLEIDIDTDSDFDNFIQDVIDNNDNNKTKKINRKLSQSTSGKDSINIPNIDNEDELSNVTENIKNFWEAYSESEDELDDYYTQSDNEEKNNIKSPRKNTETIFRKISIEKLKHKMNMQYDSLLIYNYSSALDILASYVKCHINIYMQASYNCTFLLNLFMMPCILFTSVCSIASSLSFKYSFLSLYVSYINGLISFFLAIINYLKLDACSEAHKISSYQYSKLKNYIEFTSGEILLFQNPLITNKNYINEQMNLWKRTNRYIYRNYREYKVEKHKKYVELHEEKKRLEEEIIELIQKKIIEIKKTLKNIQENNNFILPSSITKKYTHIYNINIFTYIKNIESYRLFVLNELKNVKNRLRYNHYYFDDIGIDKNILKEEIIDLYNKKNELLKEYYELNNGYALIDSMFQQELKNVDLRNKFWYMFYLQYFINFLKYVFNCSNTEYRDIYSKKQYFLPNEYKNPLHFGYIDKNGIYMLQKIMEYSRN